MTDDRIPVTVLTGFLGSGKTTLLNRILTEHHGRRIAVIENEFGEVGVDDALVLDAEEEVFEMNNGCICCTVRGDLIRILGALLRRKDRFDAVLIETTGLADPAPVAQTFFVDDALRAQLRLDAIVTVVDAKHVRTHLDDVKPEGVENEAVEQIQRLREAPAERQRGRAMSGFPTSVSRLAFAADGRWLACDGGDTVAFWDFSGAGPTGREALLGEGHPGPISALAWANTGRTLVSGDASGDLALWRLGPTARPGDRVRPTWRASTGDPVGAVAVVGERIVSGHRSGAVVSATP